MKTTMINELETVYETAVKTLVIPSSENIYEPDSLNKIFAPSFLIIGTDENEKCENINQLKKLLNSKRKHIQASRAESTVSILPVFRSYSPIGDTAVYVDEVHYPSRKAKKSISVSLRVSIVFNKMEQGWRVVHLHTSKASENETTNNRSSGPDLIKRYAALENQFRVQTIELNEALERLRENQDKLIRQEKLASLGQLTAGIAHEIKNPLNFITNFSELSAEFLEEIEENIQKLDPNDITEEIAFLIQDVKGNLEKIHHHGTRADGIVKSMLLHSRGGSGEMEDTDLNNLIKEYVNLSFHGMRANKNPINVDIRVEADENLGMVKINPENFSRVVLNLCKNAFDAMREKLEQQKNKNYVPSLTVRTKRAEDKVIVEFEDNGPGVPDEIRSKMMLPFFTTKKGTEGTGLGLSISQDIIKSHRGILEIDSIEGECTKFTIVMETQDNPVE